MSEIVDVSLYPVSNSWCCSHLEWSRDLCLVYIAVLWADFSTLSFL